MAERSLVPRWYESAVRKPAVGLVASRHGSLAFRLGSFALGLRRVASRHHCLVEGVFLGGFVAFSVGREMGEVRGSPRI